MEVTIKRVGILSAMKIGFLFFAALWVLGGIFFFLAQFALFSLLGDALQEASTSATTDQLLNDLQNLSTTALLVAYAGGIIVNGLVGMFVGLFYAVVYNFIAWIFGGLKVQLPELAEISAKRVPAYAPSQTYQPAYPQSQPGYGQQTYQQPVQQSYAYPPQQQPVQQQPQQPPQPAPQPEEPQRQPGMLDETPPRGMPPVMPDQIDTDNGETAPHDSGDVTDDNGGDSENDD